MNDILETLAGPCSGPDQCATSLDGGRTCAHYPSVQGAAPGWIVTHDYIRPGMDLPTHAGTVGPSGYDGATDTAALPIRWRALDDDGHVYYAGRMNVAALDAFGSLDPLHAFALPDAGAVTLETREGDRWRPV